MRRVVIDPVTRIEGRGRVDIVLDDDGRVGEAYFVVPDLRGFEQICVGRPAEEMPTVTSRVCGLCPEAHHLAAAKVLDRLFGVEPPPAARAIRELLHTTAIVSNHATHFFALAGPDLLVERSADIGERNLFGVLRRLGPTTARRVAESRVHNHEVVEMLGGRRIHPVAAVPGGWSRAVTVPMRDRIRQVAEENVDFALECLQLYRDRVISRPDHLELLTAEAFSQPTHSMATVDDAGRLSLFDGRLRVVDPDGRELLCFETFQYAQHIAERLESWTYLKTAYLTAFGWTGLAGGAASGIFSVGPLARLNASSGLSTPAAQKAYEEMQDTLAGGRRDVRHRPIHNRLATHWARLVEQLHAAERMVQLASLPELTDRDLRTPVPTRPVVREAVGSVEAPRGTLLHRYTVDSEGIVTSVDLIPATTLNHAAIALAITAAARSALEPGGDISDRAIQTIEMAIRAYDPCLACSTHTLDAPMPLTIVVRDRTGHPMAVVRR